MCWTPSQKNFLRRASPAHRGPWVGLLPTKRIWMDFFLGKYSSSKTGNLMAVSADFKMSASNRLDNMASLRADYSPKRRTTPFIKATF